MSKLNQVLLEWKPGDIHGTQWFKARGINQRLAYSYYEDGYLEKIGPGVFARKGDEMNPYGITRFLQQEYGLKLHLSGRTALELQGHAHYVALGSKTRIYLTSYVEKAFPSWIKKLEKKFEFIFKKSSLFGQQNFLTNHNESGFELKISTRELAALELIDTLDLSGSLETAENYLQSLLTLRSDTIQDVLEECNSIKAKRVFLYLAEKLNMPWFKKIKKDRINLGKGKRVIVKGGELDQKYQITVDRVFEENPF